MYSDGLLSQFIQQLLDYSSAPLFLLHRISLLGDDQSMMQVLESVSSCNDHVVDAETVFRVSSHIEESRD